MNDDFGLDEADSGVRRATARSPVGANTNHHGTNTSKDADDALEIVGVVFRDSDCTWLLSIWWGNLPFQGLPQYHVATM